jgi:hypothetical protein
MDNFLDLTMASMTMGIYMDGMVNESYSAGREIIHMGYKCMLAVPANHIHDINIQMTQKNPSRPILGP